MRVLRGSNCSWMNSGSFSINKHDKTAIINGTFKIQFIFTEKNKHCAGHPPTQFILKCTYKIRFLF